MGIRPGVLWLLAPILLTLTACGDSASISVGDKNTETAELPGAHTAHTNVADGIWPPQPSDISNVEGYPASARQGAEESVIDTARRAAMNHPETRAALGDNYRAFDGSLGDSKSDVTASFLFYNYSNNTTVETRMTRDGNIANDVYSASDWQPAEHREEVAQAISLGQQNLLANGYETAGLQGTAMLAFPAISKIADTDRHYYSERIMYVTFGEGDGALPVYSALVNLSTGTVTESGLVK